jgi:hypothetical protein
LSSVLSCRSICEVGSLKGEGGIPETPYASNQDSKTTVDPPSPCQQLRWHPCAFL